MSKFTRRVFIKKSGVATLGSVLGLGLLPSLTRKLHATDESGEPPGSCNINVPQSNSNGSWQCMSGTVALSISLAASTDVGQCEEAPVLSLTRTASYTRVKPRVTYKATYTEIAAVTWQCNGGTVSATSVTHPSGPPGSLDVAIANVVNPIETIGTLSVSSSAASDPAVTISAIVLIGDEQSQEYALGPLSYVPSCC